MGTQSSLSSVMVQPAPARLPHQEQPLSPLAQHRSHPLAAFSLVEPPGSGQPLLSVVASQPVPSMPQPSHGTVGRQQSCAGTVPQGPSAAPMHPPQRMTMTADDGLPPFDVMRGSICSSAALASSAPTSVNMTAPPMRSRSPTRMSTSPLSPTASSALPPACVDHVSSSAANAIGGNSGRSQSSLGSRAGSSETASVWRQASAIGSSRPAALAPVGWLTS